MNIKDLEVRQGNVDIEVEVIDKGEVREFQKFGRSGKVCTAKVRDETGEINMTLWNEDVDKVSVGDKLKLTNGYVNEYQGEKQLTTGKFGKLEIIGKAEGGAETGEAGAGSEAAKAESESAKAESESAKAAPEQPAEEPVAGEEKEEGFTEKVKETAEDVAEKVSGTAEDVAEALHLKKKEGEEAEEEKKPEEKPEEKKEELSEEPVTEEEKVE